MRSQDYTCESWPRLLGWSTRLEAGRQQSQPNALVSSCHQYQWPWQAISSHPPMLDGTAGLWPPFEGFPDALADTVTTTSVTARCVRRHGRSPYLGVGQPPYSLY